jgi:hypothetical protein
MFLAALGGRRMNKGILCGACNTNFSALDALLADQLRVINGLLGVRPDRDDEPRPALVDSSDGRLAINHEGKPAFAEPLVLADEPLADGRRAVRVLFGSEEQRQAWVAKQRGAGRDVRQVNRGEEGQRFVTEAIPVSWSFGGIDAFREIGRIAMNFLAHRWPELARSDELRPFKDFVEAKRTVAATDPRPVWYARPDDFAVPDSAFSFGHQVLIVLDAASQQVYARVRFFSVFDLCIWFGRILISRGEAVLFDIDPLAERAPRDLKESEFAPDRFPPPSPPTADPPQEVAQLLGDRLRLLLSRIEDRQWELSTHGLLEALNAARELSSAERSVRVESLLQPHAGQVLFLARFVADELEKRANNRVSKAVATALSALLAPDRNSPSGLSCEAEASLELATRALAGHVASRLQNAPLSNEELRLLLHGGPGAHVVGEALVERIAISLFRRSDTRDPE